MKSKFGKISVAIVLLAAIIICSYIYYVKQIIQNNTDRTKEINLNQDDQLLILTKNSSQERVVGLELEFSGNVSENLSYRITPDIHAASGEVKVKKGKLNHDLYLPWEKDSCYLFIQKNSGQISLIYRFISD